MERADFDCHDRSNMGAPNAGGHGSPEPRRDTRLDRLCDSRSSSELSQRRVSFCMPTLNGLVSANTAQLIRSRSPGTPEMPTLCGREPCQQPVTICSFKLAALWVRISTVPVCCTHSSLFSPERERERERQDEKQTDTRYIQTDDAPLYTRGNKQCLAICCMNIVIYLLVKAYYVWRNKQREKTWDTFTEEERLRYLSDPPDEGNKRLDFRFQH